LRLRRLCVSSTLPGQATYTPAVFRYGLTRALPLPICGEIGSLCAAEIISHFGARPEVDLSQLLAESGRT
jgi:hypothetical protein